MHWLPRRYVLPGFILACLGLTLAAYSAPGAFGARNMAVKPPPISPAQVRALTTPLSPSSVLAIVNGSSAISQAIRRVTIHGGRIAPPKLTPPPHPQSAAAAATGLLPCDFYHGVFLNVLHPMAADALPPTAWAALVMKGLETYDPWDEAYQSLAGSMKWTLDTMTCLSGIVYAEGTNPPVTMKAEFVPDQPGVYAVTFERGMARPGEAISAQIETPSGAQSLELLGTKDSGWNVTAAVLVKQLPSRPSYCEVTYTVPIPVYGYSFGGVQITHLYTGPIAASH